MWSRDGDWFGNIWQSRYRALSKESCILSAFTPRDRMEASLTSRRIVTVFFSGLRVINEKIRRSLKTFSRTIGFDKMECMPLSRSIALQGPDQDQRRLKDSLLIQMSLNVSRDKARAAATDLLYMYMFTTVVHGSRSASSQSLYIRWNDAIVQSILKIREAIWSSARGKWPRRSGLFGGRTSWVMRFDTSLQPWILSFLGSKLTWHWVSSQCCRIGASNILRMSKSSSILVRLPHCEWVRRIT